MTLAPYRSVLALPGVRRLVLFAVLARLPQTAAGVVLTLHVVEELGRGWAAAGLVGASATAGMALGAPWRGRAVDRMGLRRALAPSVVAEAAVWGSAPFLSYEWLLAAAFVGGALGLPIFTVVRQSLAVLVPDVQRRTAYAMDSIGVELSFMLGPTVGVLIATQVSTTAALLSVGVLMVGAGVALMVVNPPTRTAVTPSEDLERAAAPVRLPRAAWFTPALLSVLGATAGATVVLAGTDVSVIAHLREDGAVPLTGLIFVAWGIGSIAGGLVYGALRRPVPPLLLLLALAVLTIPVGLAGSWWMLMITILPAAALCAPLLTATAETVSRLVPEESRGEAMGWHGSALTIGSAVGAPLAGAVIDVQGAWAGFAAVGFLGIALAGVGLGLESAWRRRRPAARPARSVVGGHPATLSR